MMIGCMLKSLLLALVIVITLAFISVAMTVTDTIDYAVKSHQPTPTVTVAPQ